MSVRLRLDRTVSLVPMNYGARDAHGNEIVTEGAPVAGVRAMRDQVDADEDTRDRDTQARTFTYIFGPDPAPLALTGRDRIHDGGQVLEVVGGPEVIRRGRRTRPSHVEVRAFLLEG